MSLQITGKVIQILPVEMVGNSGKQKQVHVIEIPGQYPKKVAVEVWDDKLVFSVGENCTVHINIESREWNGKWYTSVSVWKKEGGNSATHSATQRAVSNQGSREDFKVDRGAHQKSSVDNTDSDLPF